MTFNEKREYLNGYKTALSVLKFLESREKFFELTKEEKELKEKALWQSEKIKEEISLVADPVFREILKEKYINGATNENIAENLGYSPRHVGRLHKVAVEEFQTL